MRDAAGKIRKPEKSQRGFSVRSSFGFDGLGAAHRWLSASIGARGRPRTSNVRIKAGKAVQHTVKVSQSHLGAEQTRNILPRRTKERRARKLVGFF
jgi:hypothetical protein